MALYLEQMNKIIDEKVAELKSNPLKLLLFCFWTKQKLDELGERFNFHE